MDPSLNPPSGYGFAASALKEDDERWSLVMRVAGCAHFLRAQQLRDILLFVCQKALADPSVIIREHEIGCTVLGRKPDFNTQEDTIVRVQFGHLRKKLDAYFLNEGRGEALRISIPKGSYVPLFQVHGPEERADLELVPAPLAAPAPVRRRRPVVPVAIVGTLLALLCVYFWRGSGSAFPSQSAEARNPVWARLFAARQPVNIVVADTCLVMLQDILHADIPLAHYIDGHYPENLLSSAKTPELRDALRLISSRQYSSLADTNTASKLLNLSRRYGEDRASIRYGRYLSVREFKSGNFVLMGSRRGIPWVQLFEPQLNFVMEEDPKTRLFFFRNKSPRAGEQAAYTQSRSSDSTLETFADIAVVPNLEGTGYVMILAGIGMEGAEAAGDLVSSARFTQILAGMLPEKADPSAPAYFEILLKMRAVAGAARSSQVVTYRVLPAPPPG